MQADSLPPEPRAKPFSVEEPQVASGGAAGAPLGPRVLPPLLGAAVLSLFSETLPGLAPGASLSMMLSKHTPGLFPRTGRVVELITSPILPSPLLPTEGAGVSGRRPTRRPGRPELPHREGVRADPGIPVYWILFSLFKRCRACNYLEDGNPWLDATTHSGNAGEL